MMELGPQNHNGDGPSGPDSILAVYMDPLGNLNPPGGPLPWRFRCTHRHSKRSRREVTSAGQNLRAEKQVVSGKIVTEEQEE